MTKVLLIPTAFLAFAAVAIAGPLSSKGIPAEAKGIVHVDFDAGSKSLVIQTLKQESEKAVAGESSGKKAYEDFKKQVGFDPSKDINDVTLGLIPKAGSDEPQAAIVVRGKFSPDKMVAAAKAKSIATTAYGKYTLISASALKSAYLPDESGMAADALEDLLCCPFDKSTILLGEKGTIEKAIDVYSGKSKPYAIPSTLTAYSKQVGSPIALAYVSGDLDKSEPDPNNPMQMPKMQNLYFALADDGKNVKARATSEYKDEAGAQQSQSMIQMVMGFMQMAASQTNGPDGKPDPKKVEDAKKLTKLLSSLKLSAEGKNLNVGLDYPTAEAVAQIKEQAKNLTGK
ncbi:MAG: hypothetical protein LBV12_07630 [Puniceicoccales bacterium]|jgi:hypothetical protein|nr:hypothetical protein [Puniceicoccales bacterium]